MSANAEIIAELRRVLNERDEARERNTDLRTMLEQVTRERDSYQRQLDAIGDALVTSIVKRIEPRLSRHPVTVIMAAGSLFAKIGEAIGCEFADGDDLLEAVKELVRERDEARANYQWMVDRACDEKLDGYRELAAKCAQLEEERDEAREELAGLPAWQHACEQSRLDLAEAEAVIARRETQIDEARASVADAYRRGAEAMREACATRAWDKIWDAGKRTVSLRKDFLAQAVRDALRALPIPEET